MSELRRWQSQCIEAALSHYTNQPHFFCQATPGAGKTRMAAELAKQLFERGQIDFVICFAPSCEVVNGLVRTFEQTLDKSLNGFLGAAGAAFTYQAMDYRDAAFWRLFDECRILVVFDEIHHCASANDALAGNAWGQQIVRRIQDRASYTLALSGTPWRSDERSIALARYSNPEGQLIVDYRYGLGEAVEDAVCRSPRIVMVDNEYVQVIDQEGEKRGFKSITRLLKAPGVTYEQLVQHNAVMVELIRLASIRLDTVRLQSPDAAGLIVATSIAHAHRVAALLDKRGESFVLVTNETQDAKRVMSAFRKGTQRWIVAVGMVSEGTDIPRLQVCCYLSRIRTELYYRQVLGRVLRRQGCEDKTAWFYMLEEKTLTSFAHRINDDLPDDLAVVQRARLSDQMPCCKSELPSKNDSGESVGSPNKNQHKSPNYLTLTLSTESIYSHSPSEILFSQQYRQRLLSVF